MKSTQLGFKYTREKLFSTANENRVQIPEVRKNYQNFINLLGCNLVTASTLEK